jgi:hypothetical protein
MSGPTTVILTIEPLSVLLAGSAIHAAQAVRQGYVEAAELQAVHQEKRNFSEQEQRVAQAEGEADIREQAARAEADFAQWVQLAERLGCAEQCAATRPAAPSGQSFAEWAAYIQALQGLLTELKSILQTALASMPARAADQVAEITLPDPVGGASQSVSQRLLARWPEGEPIPQAIQDLAHDLDTTLSAERTHLLAMELRAQIQAHGAALQQKQVQKATATVMEQSLKDLGYQVEPISHTLFVEGGVVHFRRAGWGPYMLRMRVDAKAQTVNFNVIRAIKEGQNERSVLDHLAEDRWCAEFPALLNALAAQGVHLKVTRRLEAGELPVQQVDAEVLPPFSDEEVYSSTPRLMSRQLP